MQFLATTATKKLTKLKKRIRGVAGGTSASKTISILLILIDYCQTHPGEVVSVVSESLPHLKKGAIRDFQNIMQSHNYWDDSSWNKTENTYTFRHPDGKVTLFEFFSADQPYKVRGPRRNVLFLNEANNVQYETFDQLEVRTSEIIWLDWNPTNEFWFYTDVLNKRDDVDFVTLTYKDNEALPESIVKTIEARRNNLRWWTVYGEGKLGEAEGRVYKDWQIIDEIPHEARLERYGMDFGYTNDPTAIVAIYYYNGGYILDEIAYQTGLNNPEIATILKNVPQSIVIADSAEPKSIDEISQQGIAILGVEKKAGSRLQMIQNVQNQRISVTKRSVNVIKEYRNYMFQTDKDGKLLNDPQTFMDHAMDAIKYGLDNLKPQSILSAIRDTRNIDYNTW